VLAAPTAVLAAPMAVLAAAVLAAPKAVLASAVLAAPMAVLVSVGAHAGDHPGHAGQLPAGPDPGGADQRGPGRLASRNPFSVGFLPSAQTTSSNRRRAGYVRTKQEL
jgi:hypothetical protein